MATLQDLSRSWQLTCELHTLHQGVALEEIEAFEEEAGWRLPSEWRAFYTYTNGAIFFKGELMIDPLLGVDGSLIGGSDRLRGYNWSIPDALWIAGRDGEGYPFGLWQPAANSQTCPLVEVEVGTYELSVVASSLNALLLFRTVCDLMHYSEGEPLLASLDILGVPPELRPREPYDKGDRFAIESWADPDRSKCSIDLDDDS